MADEQNNQQAATTQTTQVVETIQPQTWGGEPLNTSRNALSDKGENGGPIITKERSSE